MYKILIDFCSKWLSATERMLLFLLFFIASSKSACFEHLLILIKIELFIKSIFHFYIIDRICFTHFLSLSLSLSLTSRVDWVETTTIDGAWKHFNQKAKSQMVYDNWTRQTILLSPIHYVKFSISFDHKKKQTNSIAFISIDTFIWKNVLNAWLGSAWFD